MTVSRQMTIDEEYVAQRPRSAELAGRERRLVPSGVTHDARYLTPFLPYAERAQGSHKWDLDGHEYIDYVMGHGALMLGHQRPEVVAAVTEQAAKGTHFGFSNVHEVRWAELVQQLFPSIEEVKFTSSGTEATHMAMRLARAYTGRTKILKFHAHFHGWHDYCTVGMAEPWDVPISMGVPQETASTVVAAPPNDLAAVEKLLNAGDIAAVILEPTGASMGRVPVYPQFLHQLREVTARKNVVLIFDEVVTGFRVSPGGAQGLHGIKPDLTTLAKVLAGGLPGGAVGGKREIMQILEFKDTAEANRLRRIAHPGTFNANPLSAAAGAACLSIIAKGEVHEQANRMTDRLREGLKQVLTARGVPGLVHGERSLLHVHLGRDLKPENLATAKTFPPRRLERAMLVNGVHFFSGHLLILSGSHTEEDVDKTIQAFDKAIQRLQGEGDL